MFDRVLVPLDGSALAETALKAACSLAEEVFLFHAASSSAFERPAAAKYLAGVAGRLRRKGIRVQTRLRSGEPSRLLARAAVKDRIGLVVISGRGRGGGGKGPLGSVAERVLRTSPVPVLLLRGGAKIRRVLVPLRQGCAGLIATVGELARPLRARVALLHPGARKDRRLLVAMDVLTRLGIPARVSARGGAADLVAVADLGAPARRLLRDSGRSLLLVRRGA